MKKIYAFILSGAAILAVTACNKETHVEDPAQNNGPVYETLSVKIGTETKVTLNTGAAKSSFESDDKIAVWTDAGEFQTCLVDAEGKITVDVSGGARSNYAVYYNGATIPTFESSTLKITLPDTYDYADVAGDKNPVPMVAMNVAGETGDMTFYAVCALARITVPGIPATADKLVVTFNKDVTGEFTVANPGETTPSIPADAESTKNVVTINLTPGTDYSGAVINIPVPVGTITASVQAKAGDTVLETKSDVISGWSAARARGKIVTSAFTPSIYSRILAPGNLYTESGTLKMASNYYSHAYAISSTDDFYLTDSDKYNVENRTHFNFNETYWLMNGTKPTMELANDNVGTEPANLSMTRSDFGDGKTWRVPTYEDWTKLVASSRPGTTLNGTPGYRYVTAVVSEMDGSGTSIAEPTFDNRNVFTSLTPNTNYQAGLLIFPDNVVLSGEFDPLGAPNEAFAKYYPTKITKENLDNLIAAGCAFLPSVGSPSTGGPIRVGFSAHYWASTITSGTHAYSFIIFSHNTESLNQVNVKATASKPGNFRTVRLVRDLN